MPRGLPLRAAVSCLALAQDPLGGRSVNRARMDPAEVV